MLKAFDPVSEWNTQFIPPPPHTHKSEEHYLFRLTGTGKKAPNKRKRIFKKQFSRLVWCTMTNSVCVCVHVSTQVHCTQIIYFQVTLFLPTWSMQCVHSRQSTQHSQDSCWSSLWQTVLHRQCCHQHCSPQTMLPSTVFSTDKAAINTVLHRQCCHQQCSPQTMLPSTLFSTDNAAINSVLHRQSCHQHCSPQTMLPSTVFSTKLPSTAASLH